MPPITDRSRSELWIGAGDAWTMVADLVSAIAVWGAIGYGLDRVFHTWPALFVVGVVVGHAAGVYVLWLRAQRQTARAQARAKKETE